MKRMISILLLFSVFVCGAISAQTYTPASDCEFVQVLTPPLVIQDTCADATVSYNSITHASVVVQTFTMSGKLDQPYVSTWLYKLDEYADTTGCTTDIKETDSRAYKSHHIGKAIQSPSVVSRYDNLSIGRCKLPPLIPALLRI